MTHSRLEWLARILDRRGRDALSLARAKHAALAEREHALARVTAKLEAVGEQKRALAAEVARTLELRRLALARNRLAFVWDCERALDAERAQLAGAVARARREFVDAERAYRALRGKSDRTRAERTRDRVRREEQAGHEVEELVAEAPTRPRGRYA